MSAFRSGFVEDFLICGAGGLSPEVAGSLSKSPDVSPLVGAVVGALRQPVEHVSPGQVDMEAAGVQPEK
jgi:hypothetical protein